MPTMDSWTPGTKPFKGLIIGDSGSGKTALISFLANEGYELFWADFDNGLRIVPSVIKSKSALARIHYRTFTDKLHVVGGNVFSDGMPSAATSFQEMLSNWMDGGKAYGPLHTWGLDRVLIMDSLTFFGQSLLRRTLFLNKRNGQKPWQGDWGEAMDVMENVLAFLYSDAIKCNVIITAHVTTISKTTGEVDAKGEEIMIERAYPSALGSKLPPKVGRYFDLVLKMVSTTRDNTTVRQLFTKGDAMLDLKCPAVDLPFALPQETGLATVFKALGIPRPGAVQIPSGGSEPAAPAAGAAA